MVRFFCQNEALFLCEFDARQKGLLDTIDWFSTEFDDATARSVVLNGLNSGGLGRNVMLGCRGRDIGSLDEAYELFRRTRVVVEFEQKRYGDSVSGCQDEIALALHLFDNDGDSSWDYFRDRFLNARSGLEQERMIAATHVYLHPDIKSQFAVFDVADVSPGAIFGRDFSESRESMLRRMPDIYLSPADVVFLGDCDCKAICRRDVRDLDAAYDGLVRNDIGLDDMFDIDM